MDKAYPPEAWKRLGRELERRRGQLGYGFRQRENFLRDRGGPPPSLKMIARLERGERTSYPAATITALESLYGYAPGSFEAILEGREPVPALRAEALPAAPSPLPLSLEGDEETVARTIMDLPSPGGGLVPWGVRRDMLQSLLEINDRRRADAAG